MAKTRKGVMPCEGQNCESHARHQAVVVFENERGTLNYSCDWCGRSPYAKPGTGQHQEWLDALEPFAAAAPKLAPVATSQPVAAPAPQPEPKAAPKSRGLLLS